MKTKSLVSIFFRASKGFASKSNIDPFGGQYLATPPPNPNRFLGKVAIVTGGAAGVGLETSLLLAHSGVEGLVIADMNEAGGQKAVEVLNKANPKTKTIFVKMDLSNQSEIKRVFDATEKSFGKLNILVNNAGKDNFIDIYI